MLVARHSQSRASRVVEHGISECFGSGGEADAGEQSQVAALGMVEGDAGIGEGMVVGAVVRIEDIVGQGVGVLEGCVREPKKALLPGLVADAPGVAPTIGGKEGALVYGEIAAIKQARALS